MTTCKGSKDSWVQLKRLYNQCYPYRSPQMWTPRPPSDCLLECKRLKTHTVPDLRLRDRTWVDVALVNNLRPCGHPSILNCVPYRNDCLNLPGDSTAIYVNIHPMQKMEAYSISMFQISAVSDRNQLLSSKPTAVWKRPRCDTGRRRDHHRRRSKCQTPNFAQQTENTNRHRFLQYTETRDLVIIGPIEPAQ